MDKNAIKKFAVWARTELISRVSLKGVEYGITEDNIEDANADSVGGKVLSVDEKKQRQALIAEINDKGYKQVMEEIAYTWFNRFSALRFMEVNGYLPSHVRVFTDEQNNFKPQIITEAIHLDLDGLDMEKVYELKDTEKTEELYKYLLIVQCNALNKILPGMFQKIADYTELLLPDNLLREGSVIQQMIELIPEKDWREQIEIIGWIYQYYISERHEQIVNPIYGKGFAKEDIPSATQIFTTDWVVCYMVDNSLGRYWIERHPESSLSDKLQFFVKPKNEEIAYIKEKVTPQEMTFFDPCMGSGHILVYAFDVLMEIYRECGYTDREAVSEILQNNLFGLDIDERCSQLAYFAVMMKARSYDHRFLTRGIKPHVLSIRESNTLGAFTHRNFMPDKAQNEIGEYLTNVFRNAKEIGSLQDVKVADYEGFQTYLRTCANETTLDIEVSLWQNQEMPLMAQLAEQAKILSKKYTVVCTNPPYMNNLKGELRKFILSNFKDFSGDLFGVFTVRNLGFAVENGYSAYMTPNVWMYIKSFERLREYIISNKSISSFLLLAKGAFYKEATVDVCSFVLTNKEGVNGEYIRLEQYKGDMDNQKNAFLDRQKIIEDGNFFTRSMLQFKKISGCPIAFWISDNMLDTFSSQSMENITTAKAGIVSGNDSLFLRLWHEVEVREITFDATNFDDHEAYHWVPLNKGGAYRRHYGNYEYVINIYDIWNSDKVNESVRRSDPDFYFKRAMSWSYVTTGKSSFRITENKTSGTAAPNLFFGNDRDLFYALAFTNCCITQKYLDLLNPTINLNVTNVSTLPFIISDEVIDYVVDTEKENIAIAKQDWDAYENSWDFQQHPLLRKVPTIAEAFEQWKTESNNRFNRLKANEEELNRIFIDIYGLQDELISEVDDKDITVRKADLGRDIRSFISYAVGCMFGRYSLDVDGLAYAGGEWDASKYVSFAADTDNIIPICDDEYFEDDIVGLFVKFVKIVYGADTLDENLKFIADVLGSKDQPKDVIRNYFLNDFYKDHCKIYQKRPIYWLFDSGKKNGFKALIYMHRYQSDTIARIRTDYVHEQQARYRTAIANLEQRIANVSTSERVKLNKKLAKLQVQDTELRNYEEKIHHLADQMISIDLDDGVKKNYAIFQDVLAKIK